MGRGGSTGSPEEAAALEGLSPGWLQVRSHDVALEETEASLGRGEEEVIALARDIGAEYVVLDDLAARDLAVSRGLRVIGTVGILIAARRKGVIPSVIPLLENLREEGFPPQRRYCGRRSKRRRGNDIVIGRGRYVSLKDKGVLREE